MKRIVTEKIVNHEWTRMNTDVQGRNMNGSLNQDELNRTVWKAGTL